MLATSLFFLFGCTKTWPVSPNTISTTNQQNDIDRQTYTSKKDRFSIQFPGGWTFQENVYGSTVMFFSPTDENDKIRENIGIIKEALDKEYTLDEYYDITKWQLTQLIPGFTEVTNETITINDTKAKKLIYKGTQGNTKLKREQVYLIKNSNIYIITYTAAEDTFDSFIQQFDEMITTLEIK